MKKLLWLIFFLGLILRLYQVGRPVFKEEEFSTVKAAAYIFKCGQDPSRCRHQPSSFSSRLLALMTANETIPNLAAEIYWWDFIKDKASETHFSRAWPHLYLVAGVYRLLGLSEFFSRLVSVVAGSLLVVAGYWLSRTLGSSVRLSLLYSTLLAIAFPLIDFSRHARMYSLYGLVFLILVGLIYRSKWLAAALLFLLAYWLQMLTLILPIALLVWAIIGRRRRIVAALLLGLLIVFGLTKYYGADFFQRQFLTLVWPPHWQYLDWWFIGAIIVTLIKRQKYLLSINLVYLLVLIFFTRPAPGEAYLIALWPLILWPLINWRRWLTTIVTLIVLIRFAGGINYLYFGRDDRAQIPSAYAVIKNNFQPGDKIYAVQLRDYYLQDLPEDTPVIDLQKEPDAEFNGSGFVVWEEEKIGHLKPETLEYVRTNFEYLGSRGVEIYSFGK